MKIIKYIVKSILPSIGIHFILWATISFADWNCYNLLTINFETWNDGYRALYLILQITILSIILVRNKK